MQVDGGMLTSFGGRAHVTTYVSAGVDIFPGTGFNGGRTVVSDFAQVDLGYETSRRLGNPSDALTLTFTVPFTYDRPISITMALSAGASARLLGGVVPLIADGAGVATSDYANTMHWLGMSEVRDSSNQLVTDFSAVSTTSDFDFEVSAVPEPDQALLLLATQVTRKATPRRRSRKESGGHNARSPDCPKIDLAHPQGGLAKPVCGAPTRCRPLSRPWC